MLLRLNPYRSQSGPSLEAGSQWLIFLFRLRGQGVHKGRPYGIGSRWARLLTEQPGDGAGELLRAVQVRIEGVG